MIRTVEPEILDSLPFDHPEALRNRRDLVTINRLMGNYRWFARTGVRHLTGADHVVEAGAGDGRLARVVCRRLPGIRYTAVDPCPAPAALPAGVGWQRCAIHECAALAGADALIANLFLHQLSDGELRLLGAAAERGGVRIIIASEPVRRRSALRLIRLGRWIGFAATTVHDGAVSVRAGFRDGELPDLLGLDPARWRWTCTTRPMGACRMVAVRR